MTAVQFAAASALAVTVIWSLLPTILADCTYEGTRYSEGSSVPTAEPCLRCACSKGTLLCYLRICPELPDPPPPGCLILHRHRTCCPELICTANMKHALDLPIGGNRIEARLEPDLPDIPYNHSDIGNGCILNGTVYGSGSAMQSSSLCEYCYCISGKQHCVKPKCLLPVEGCKALYAAHSCCPTHYKCNGSKRKTLSTTTTAAAPLATEDSGGGCLVSGKKYPEGGKILGVGHSPCDNCYCMRGVVRCVPLSCAPPLLGCTPVVPPGECCAASYNCSGVIEVQPTLNYGHYPVVSKEYAKLRKEVQQNHYHRPKPNSEALSKEESKHPLYVIAESSHPPANYKFTQKSSTPYYFTSTSEGITSTILPTSRQSTATTKHLPISRETLSPESSNKYSRISLTTTRVKSNADGSSPMRPVFKPSDLITKPPWKTNQLNNIPPMILSPVYKPENSAQKPSNEYLPSLTTSDEGLAYSSLISKRKYENSTPRILKYSNYIDIDFGDDLFMDGRNNRRIDDQLKSESRIEVSENLTTTTENPTTLETTEPTYSTETTETTTEFDASTTEITVETTTDFQDTQTTLQNQNSTSTILPPTVPNNTSTNFTKPNSTVTSLSNDSEKNNTKSSIINITKTEIIGNNTECIDGTSTNDTSLLENRDGGVQKETTTEEITEEPEVTSTPNPTTVENLEVASKTEASNTSATSHPFKKFPPEIEAILNISKNINKKDEDYEYDYNEPSLPPSLPNLKIIPFVAADAVVEEKESPTVSYPTVYPPHAQDNLRGTDDPLYGYTLNLFSPPIETEGGFVPRDPPILNTYYENGYHTTGIVDITAGTSVPAITNPPKTNDDNCIVEGREVRHGELTSELGACSICLCLFGDIVCQPPKCPPPPAGCRRTQASSATPVCCGHVVCNGEEESPTVVLDRIDVTSNPQENVAAERIGTPDPFRDVIRTEPAPDLQSLIGDIMPYLVRHTSTLKPTTHMMSFKSSMMPAESKYTSQKQHTTTEMPVETKHEEENDFSLDTVLKLLFSDEKEPENETSKPDKTTARYKTEPSTTESVSSPAQKTTLSKYRTTAKPDPNSWYLASKTQTDSPSRNSIEGPSSVGLLKLAGCNIYGRMYRVGRIISELSGPCLECMCTEIGVQCRPLNC